MIDECTATRAKCPRGTASDTPNSKGNGTVNTVSKLLATLALVSGPLAADAEGYLCVANMTTGFEPDKVSGNWKQADYKSDAKYPLSAVKPDDDRVQEYVRWGRLVGHLSAVDWVVNQLRDKNLQGVCATPDVKHQIGDLALWVFGDMRCDGLQQQFVFNLHTLRFTVALFGGFAAKQTDSTAIQVGECSRL